jgi:hypothetical protein
MRNQLLVYNVLLILIAIAWLHLIQWDYPIFQFYKVFGGRSMEILPWMLEFNKFFGAFFTICAVALIIRLKWIKDLLLLSGIVLFCIALAEFIKKYPYFNEIMEHGIRYTTPMVLYLILVRKVAHLSLLMRVAIAATFIGHGIYAVGLLPVPQNFIDMSVAVFGFSEEGARIFLLIAGILDFIVGIGLFIPVLIRPSLLYCIFWGLATAVARVISKTDLPIEEIIFRWVPEMLLRLPNGLMPLWLLLTFYPRPKKSISI